MSFMHSRTLCLCMWASSLQRNLYIFSVRNKSETQGLWVFFYLLVASCFTPLTCECV